MATQDPSLPSSYPPSATALLLLDYHGLLVQSIQPQNVRETLISSVQQLIEAARQNSIPIIHGLVDFHGQPHEASKMTERWNTTYKPMIAKSPEVAEEWPAFRAQGSYEKEHTVIRTPGVVSVIKSDGIMDLLTERYGVKSIVIAGISTSGAVLSAAREAADLGFVTTIVEDGCWDRTEDVHRMVLDTILANTVGNVRLEEGLKLLQGQK